MLLLGGREARRLKPASIREDLPIYPGEWTAPSGTLLVIMKSNHTMGVKTVKLPCPKCYRSMSATRDNNLFPMVSCVCGFQIHGESAIGKFLAGLPTGVKAPPRIKVRPLSKLPPLIDEPTKAQRRRGATTKVACSGCGRTLFRRRAEVDKIRFFHCSPACKKVVGEALPVAATG